MIEIRREDMEMLVRAIKRIVKIHGKEGFNSSKTFCAMIDVLVPKLEKERKIFRRVLDDDILKELGELWESDAGQTKDSWEKIEEILTDEYGIREDWCRIVVDSFFKAYHNENMSQNENSTQSQTLEKTKEITVTKYEEIQKGISQSQKLAQNIADIPNQTKEKNLTEKESSEKEIVVEKTEEISNTEGKNEEQGIADISNQMGEKTLTEKESSEKETVVEKTDGILNESEVENGYKKQP